METPLLICDSPVAAPLDLAHHIASIRSGLATPLVTLVPSQPLLFPPWYGPYRSFYTTPCAGPDSISSFDETVAFLTVNSNVICVISHVLI